LRLNVDDLGEIIFYDGNTGGLEVRQKANLVGLKDQKRSALGVAASGSSTDTVNVVAGVIRRIELDNPVNGRNIETTSGNVSADQSTLLGIAELEKGVGSLLLLLFAVEIKNRNIDIVEEFGVVFHTSTTTEEDNDLLLEVALEE